MIKDGIELAKETRENHMLINISGKLNFHNVKDLTRYMENSELLSELGEKKNLVLNFQNLVYVDSSGLGAIMQIQEEIKKMEARLYLLNLSSSIEHIFNIAGLTGHFELIDQAKYQILFE